jgi:hypothetical protein
MKKIHTCLLAMMLMVPAMHLSATEPASLPEPEGYIALQQESSKLFLAKDYAGLDARMAHYIKQGTRSSSGRWASGIFAENVLYGKGTPFASHPESIPWWKDLEKQVQGWVDASPNSPLAHLIMTQVKMNHAWHIRGGGYASTVPASAWKPFREEMARARRYLLKQSKIVSRYPEYYELRIDLETALGGERETVDAIYDEATRRFPDYYPVYFSMTNYLLPKWHGDIDAVEAFARDAVQRSRKTEGQGMYARIYWVVAQAQFRDTLFKESGVHWTHMRSGFDDVIKRYPDQWNIQNYAHFACLARDHATFRKLSPRIKTAIPSGIWAPPNTLEACRKAAKAT